MRNAIRWSSLTLAAALWLAPSAHALKYSTSFIEFELPNNWNCIREGGNWYCDSQDPQKKRDGALVMAAKLKGPLDTIKDYEEHLNQPRKYSQNSKTITSEKKYVADKSINGQVWVDSLHGDSEVPGFFTRYLATVKDDVGVLVTWSIDKKKYHEYEKQFDALVASIKVFHKPRNSQTMASAPDIMAPSAVTGNGIFGKVDGETGSAPVGAIRNKVKQEGGGALGLVLLLAAAGGGFFIWKKKKQQSGG